MIKSKLKKKLKRETFKRKDEILLGGLRYDLMDMHEHSGNPNLKPKSDRRLSFKERSQKHRAYMQIADDVAEAFRSLTLDGLVLLTSKKLDLYELHEQIPNFTRNGIQRDYDMLPNVGSTCDNLVKLHIIGYSNANRLTGYWGLSQYVHMMATFGWVYFGIEPPRPEKRISAEKYLPILHKVFADILAEAQRSGAVNAYNSRTASGNHGWDAVHRVMTLKDWQEWVTTTFHPTVTRTAVEWLLSQYLWGTECKFSVSELSDLVLKYAKTAEERNRAGEAIGLLVIDPSITLHCPKEFKEKFPNALTIESSSSGFKLKQPENYTQCPEIRKLMEIFGDGLIENDNEQHQ